MQMHDVHFTQAPTIGVIARVRGRFTTRCLLLAAGTIVAMAVNSQPMPKDSVIPEPTVPAGEASVVITDDTFGGPRNVRYKSVPQSRSGATTSQARPSAVQATGPASQAQPVDKTSQEVASISEWSNRFAFAASPFSVVKGLIPEDPFAAFVFGIGTAVLMWVMVRALIFIFRLVFRGPAIYMSPLQRDRSTGRSTIDAQPLIDYSPAQAYRDADVRRGIARPSSQVAVEGDDTPAYLNAVRELETEHPDEGILAKAYALADGDPDRTRAAYIRLRAEQLGHS